MQRERPVAQLLHCGEAALIVECDMQGYGFVRQTIFQDNLAIITLDWQACIRNRMLALNSRYSHIHTCSRCRCATTSGLVDMPLMLVLLVRQPLGLDHGALQAFLPYPSRKPISPPGSFGSTNHPLY